MLTFATTFVALPIVSAHDPAWDIPTFAYVSTTPTTVGVGQTTLVVMWLNTPPMTAQGPWGDRWDNFYVDVTGPGGQETLGPFTSDPVGSAYTSYTPTQVGTYTLVFRFEGDTITGEPYPEEYHGNIWGVEDIVGSEYINDNFLPSQSDPITLVVQEDPILPYQETPLPTQYWTRPISGANRDWYQVAGNWLGGAAQNFESTSNFAYGPGPESAHIMWTRPFWAGGVMDTRFGNNAYYNGMDYEEYWRTPIIINGKLYYNVETPPRYGWYCVDLYTGETDYFHNTTGPIITSIDQRYDWDAESGYILHGRLAFGQILEFESPNQHGGFPYLWSTPYDTFDFFPVGNQENWMMFDAFSGNYICSIANVSDSGTQVYSKDGSILFYDIVGTPDPANPWGPQGPPFYLQCWNSSWVIWYNDPWTGVEQWLWRPYLGHVFDGNNGFSLNVSVPELPGGILAVREDQYIIGGTSGKNNGTFIEEGTLWALSLEPGKEGTLLWEITFTPPQATPDIVPPPGFYGAAYMSGPEVDPEDGVFIFRDSLTRRFWGYSLETGEMLWGPTESEEQWGFYDAYVPTGGARNIYDGKLLSYGYGGELVAYDITTGDKLWTWSSEPEGLEGYYPKTPVFLVCIADGKGYLYSTEHSPGTPLRRDSQLWCVDLSDGTLLWKIQHWGMRPAIADGYLLMRDSKKMVCIRIEV